MSDKEGKPNRPITEVLEHAIPKWKYDHCTICGSDAGMCWVTCTPTLSTQLHIKSGKLPLVVAMGGIRLKITPQFIPSVVTLNNFKCDFQLTRMA